MSLDREKDYNEGGETDPVRLLDEIQAAETLRDRHLGRWPDMVARFAGPGYAVPTPTGRKYDPEAFAFEYVSLVLPRLAYDNPRVAVQSRAEGPDAKKAATRLRYGLNLWATLLGFDQQASRLAMDYLFGWCVCVILPRAVPWYRDAGPDDLPRVQRLDPGDYFTEAVAKHDTEATFRGHRWTVKRRDLLAWAKKQTGEGWDMEAIRALPNTDQPVAPATDTASDRDEGPDDTVEVYQVWRANSKSGRIYTLARAWNSSADVRSRNKPNWIRKPQDYKGPPTGPYEVGGAFDVPNDPYYLGPILAIDEQINDHNSEVKTIQVGVSEYRRGTLVRTADRAVAKAISEKGAKLVQTVPDLTKDAVIPFEVGGVTPQMVEHAAMSRERLDRVSGLDDAMRGNVRGQATATELTIAEAGGNARLAWIQSRFHGFIQRVLRKVGHLLWTGGSMAATPLGARAARNASATFAGGTLEEFEAMDLSIEPYSMGRVSEAMQSQRGLQIVQLLGNLAQIIPATPWVKWQETILPQLGDMLGFDLEDAIDMAQLQLSGAGQGMPGAQGAVPRVQGPMTPQGLGSAARRVG